MADDDDSLGLIGTTIADKYKVEAVVGLGGFATVYKAIHILWNRPVAVKVFKALGEVDERQRKKLLDDFIQEGALLADLSERSTAIVQARDIGTLTTPAGEHVPYMVLEWLEGQTLEAALEHERNTGAPLRSMLDAVRLLEPVAEALALAHKKGIAHRDVKPANVFVLGDARAPDAAVKLLDFGIAKVVQDAQKMGFGKTAGHITSFTPFYGAPEQFDRAYGATGPWTDVFALALVVAEVVSGREPMSGDTIVQLAYASADTVRRPTPGALGVETGTDVEAILRRAVAVKPAERWQTVGEFWAALRGAVGVDPMSSRSPQRLVPSAPGSAQSLADSETELLTDASSVAVVPSATDATALPPSAQAKSKTPFVIVGVVVAALGLVGVALVALKSPAGGASSVGSRTPVASSTSAPSAAATGPRPACPAGMLLVPGGEFFMGSDEKDALPFEKPAHKVKLAPFCMDEFEVTVAQYKECSDRGACKRAGRENVWPGIKPVQHKIYDPLCNITEPEAKANHPINCVDWEQARAFCEGRDAKLPTEAEWELAARGSDGRIYPWGDAPPSATLLNACGPECVAWQQKHPDPEHPAAAMYTDGDGFPTTAPVGSFPKGKSRYGVHDLVGNVWEWVGDWYAAYDKAAPSTAMTAPTGPATGTDRVIRGGSWNAAEASWVRPSFRFHVAPDARSYGFGFRCAKAL